MYKLLGSDQKEYGPVSADQVRAWISQGRANGRSQLQAAGSTEWKPLAAFPEFADALKAMAGGPAPSLPGAQAQPALAPTKTSGLAIASLVLGCLGLFSCGVTSLVGVVLGIIALVRINKSQGRLGGQGLALAGMIVSVAFLLLGLLGGAMLLPALSKAKAKAQSIQCMSNVKQLELALMMYANDNKEEFPSGDKWCEALKPYLSTNTNVFICLQGAPGRRCHYALNSQVAGHSTKDIQSPATTVLIFECDGGWNVSGGRELLPASPRHGGAYVVGFADGHVEMRRAPLMGQLHWEP
jgi:prepilin-type processing-associated H-X9-DG protein